MARDIDWIAADLSIKKISKILGDVPHGERTDIANDIIEFCDKIEIKYKQL